MIGVVVVVALLVAVILGPAAYVSLRRWRRKEPDWWPEFEREFRDYVAQRQGRFRDRTPRRHDEPPGHWAA